MAVYKKDNDFYIDYYVNGRRRREKIGTSRKLAHIVLKKRKVEIAEGRYLDIKKNAKIKFEDFADEFYRLHSLPNNKLSTSKRKTVLLKNLKSFFGGRYLYAVTPMLVEEYKIKRSEKVKPATVNKELACLKCLYNKAIEWGKAESSPAAKVKLFRGNNYRLRYLEKEEVKKLLKACSPHIKPIVILALHTGMRKGEILNLKWQDISVNRCLIYLLETKNNEKREVYMNDTVKATLIKVLKHPDSPYVFCNKHGKPYANVRKSFDTALRKSGIMGFRFHDLRHTFASHLVMAGVDIKTVQELMGHKSIEMTLRYSHLSLSHKRRAVDILGKRMDTYMDTKPKSKESLEKLFFVTDNNTSSYVTKLA